MATFGRCYQQRTGGATPPNLSGFRQERDLQDVLHAVGADALCARIEALFKSTEWFAKTTPDWQTVIQHHAKAVPSVPSKPKGPKLVTAAQALAERRGGNGQ